MLTHDRKVIGVYKEFIYEDFEHINLWLKGVVNIEYHTPSGEGDAHYVDVFMDSGVARRVFKPDEIIFDKEE